MKNTILTLINSLHAENYSMNFCGLSDYFSKTFFSKDSFKIPNTCTISVNPLDLDHCWADSIHTLRA